MNRITSGEIAITLDGEERTLKPSLGAATRVNNRFGGFSKAIAELAALNLDAYVVVIGHGLGATDAEQKVLKEKVYKTGVTNLVRPLTRFVVILANGGRDPDEDEGGDDAGNG